MENKLEKMEKYGYSRDINNKILEELFRSHGKFKIFNVSVKMDEKAYLLGRTNVENVKAEIEDSAEDLRLRVSKDGNYLLNVAVNGINDCIYKQHSPKTYRFIFGVSDDVSMNITIGL